VHGGHQEKSWDMVTELQFVAVAVFLIWGLAASLCGLLKSDDTDLVQRDRESTTRGAKT
jgi:hypothetical protein